jgi:hypothetical protein
MRLSLAVLFVAISLGTPTGAVAQSPSADEPAQNVRPLPSLSVGRRVWIGLTDGRELAGRVTAVDPAAITLRGRGRITPVPVPDIVTIAVPDSSWDGARRGAIAGGISGAVFFGALAYAMRCESNCGSSYSVAGDVAVSTIWLGGFTAAVGALTGLAIDRAAGGRRIIYGPAAPPRAVELSLLVRPGGIGLGLTWRGR